MSSILSTRILTVAVGCVWGRGLTRQHLAAAEQLVLNHRPLLVHDASQNSSVVLEKQEYYLLFLLCPMWEERFLTRDLRFSDYQSGVVWVRCEGGESSINHYWKQILWREKAWESDVRCDERELVRVCDIPPHRPQSIEIFFENGHVGNQLGVILDH